MDGGSRNNQAYNLSLLTTYDSIVGYHTLGSPVLVTDRARKDRSRTCRSMQNIRLSKSARSLRNTSLAQRRMISVRCCVKQWSSVRESASAFYLSVNCQDWVAMRLRFLPLSRNSLTVALTSTYKRNNLHYWTMKDIRPSLPR